MTISWVTAIDNGVLFRIDEPEAAFGGLHDGPSVPRAKHRMRWARRC